MRRRQLGRENVEYRYLTEQFDNQHIAQRLETKGLTLEEVGSSSTMKKSIECHLRRVKRNVQTYSAVPKWISIGVVIDFSEWWQNMHNVINGKDLVKDEGKVVGTGVDGGVGDLPRRRRSWGRWIITYNNQMERTTITPNDKRGQILIDVSYDVWVEIARGRC